VSAIEREISMARLERALPVPVNTPNDPVLAAVELLRANRRPRVRQTAARLPLLDLAWRPLDEPDDPSLAINHDLAGQSAELESRMRSHDKCLGFSRRHRPRAPPLVPPVLWTTLSADLDRRGY